MLYKEKYEGIFLPIYNFYNNNVLDVSSFPFENIYYTDNIKEDVFMFCTPNNNERLDIYGATILPNDILDEIVVLINISSENLNIFATTIIHELTHVNDFINFSNYFYKTKYYNLHEHNFFDTFQRWSEFHAHSYGEYYGIQYIYEIFSSMIEKEDYIDVYKEGMIKFLKSKRQDIVSFRFSLNDLAIILGKTYTLDIHSGVQVAEQSCVYQYLPLIFHSNLIEKIYNLHKVYFDSLKNCNILENLENLKNLEEVLLC